MIADEYMDRSKSTNGSGEGFKRDRRGVLKEGGLLGLGLLAGCMGAAALGVFPTGDSDSAQPSETARSTETQSTTTAPEGGGTTTGPPQDQLVQEFRFNAQNTFEVTPAVSGNRIFAPNTDRNLYAVNVTSGNPLWAYELNAPAGATPAVGESAVFTNMADDNKMYSLDQDSGTVNWESNPEYTTYFNSPSFNGESVFVSDDGVTAHNRDNGNVEWRYDFDGTLYTSSTVQLTEKNVINTSEFGVFAVRQSDGSEQWQFEGSGEAIPDSLSTTSDRVVYTDNSNTIYIIDSRSGESINQISTSSTVSEISVVDDVLYYTDEGLTALEINSGNELWKTDLSLEKLSETTLNGYIFGIDFEEIVGVDISTGESVLTASQTTPFNAEPVVAGDYVVMPNEGNSLIGYQIVSNSSTRTGTATNSPESVIRTYLNTFFGGDPTGFNEVRHSNSPVSKVSEEDTLININIKINKIEYITRDQNRIVASVTTTATGEDLNETTTSQIELRKESNQWKFWNDTALQ